MRSARLSAVHIIWLLPKPSIAMHRACHSVRTRFKHLLTSAWRNNAMWRLRHTAATRRQLTKQGDRNPEPAVLEKRDSNLLSVTEEAGKELGRISTLSTSMRRGLTQLLQNVEWRVTRVFLFTKAAPQKELDRLQKMLKEGQFSTACLAEQIRELGKVMNVRTSNAGWLPASLDSASNKRISWKFLKHRQLDNSATRHSKTRDVDRTCDQLCSPKGNWSGWSDASTSWSSWPGTRQTPQRSQRSHAIRQGQHRIAGSVQCQLCLAGQRRTLSWQQWRRKVDNGPSQVT